MNYDPLKLENQICFPLYACAKEVTKKYKPFLDEIGLTYTQYITMMVLWENKTMNVKTLGEYLYLDSGTLTPMLKKLEAAGLVTRSRSALDERNLTVELTEAGEGLRDKAVDIPRKMGDCINITPEDAAALHSLLYNLLGQL
jgi:DNA-binding MarR family transcriptional regulator